MFTICTSYLENGYLDEGLEGLKKAEKKFNESIGVLSRQFFQCIYQPHVIWTLTEWKSEKAHNDAAESIMKIRRDDRISSIAFKPEPYFEIFCSEDTALNRGVFCEDNEFIIIAHGLISKLKENEYFQLRNERFNSVKDRFDWLRIYHNYCNPAEFTAFMSFKSEDKYNLVKMVGDMYLEEYVFTGLQELRGMSYLAGYNQFICKTLKVK